ncbi:cytochrome c oxidase assembly protein [Paenibacillus sp. GP183]|jgi:putative membrane protein|uniref:cytochrome c oxidase assembly protein n=1 Tax=Paenibacillus sp. GP183 TaxID=1882751 RepID=UPI00089D581D|nr:cytochrome c oxidase assembly protein [Paenibacillus sp. GP183]SEC49152.1 putative membrane protein [Paenibacillus sp. GP183]
MDPMYQAAGFFDLWNPVLLLLVVVVGFVYSKLANANKESIKGAEPVSLRQRLAFHTGLTLFYIGQGSPINYIGHHYLFSIHMLQQTILYLTVPIFIWTGLPEWMLRPLVKNRSVHALLSFFTKPLVAIFMFNVLLSIYHMPFIMDSLMKHSLWLLGYHLILLITAFLMWFPVFCPLPELNRLSDLRKIAYIFANGVMLTPACALIIFSDTLLYEMYTNVTVPFSHLSPLDDQQLGGVLMKIIQEIVYGSVLAYVFFRWYRRERLKEHDDYPQGYEPQEDMNTPPGNWNRA